MKPGRVRRRCAKRLDDYADKSLRELDAAAHLVGALYATMHNFPLFARLTLLYFAAASFSETSRRLGRVRTGSFLLHDDERFGPMLSAAALRREMWLGTA